VENFHSTFLDNMLRWSCIASEFKTELKWESPQMKKTLLRLSVFILVIGIHTAPVRADGWFQFVNSAFTPVLERDPLTQLTSPVPVLGGKVEFMYAPLGTTNLGLFQLAEGYGPVNINPLPGRFMGGTFRLNDIAPGATISALVRGWTGNSATWEEALLSGSAKVGISEIFLIATTDPTPIPPLPPANMVFSIPGQGFAGLILQVPEPSVLSVISLSALGWAWRRRLEHPSAKPNA